MTFQSDAIEGQKTKKPSPISVFMPAAAFIATTGLLGVIEPGLGVIMGAAASLSLSMTFVSLVQTPAQFENTTAKLDVAYAVLIGMYASFTFFPPKAFLFENFYCYQYTGDYGILPDYEPYRVFTRPGDETPGGGVNYCEGLLTSGLDPESVAAVR